MIKVSNSAMKLMMATQLILACALYPAKAQQDTIPQVVTFKEIGAVKLQMEIFRPAGFVSSRQYPAIVFFFGGGWKGGSIKQFRRQALYFASRGMVTALADYRVLSRNNTTPFDAVNDAKSAVRFLRKNASKFNIDPQRLAAAGGSAGGHLAAAADLTKLDEPSEDGTVSSRPDALVLFNPVFNNGPGEYGYERVGERYPEISPYHNIRPGAAPTIVFLGTKDALIPVSTAQAYQTKMKENGNRCELFLYPDQAHGFFNTGENYIKTVREADLFLASLGYIQGKPTL